MKNKYLKKAAKVLAALPIYKYIENLKNPHS